MKTIQQLSVFIENKFGRLNEILEVLGGANVSIVASSVADTTEYGILRLITSDTEKVAEVFRAANINIFISEVLAVSCKSDAGHFAGELKNFAKEGVVIEYMYSFSRDQETVMILKANDLKAAQRAIEKHNITLIPEALLIKY